MREHVVELATPEPGTMILFLTGGGLLLLASRLHQENTNANGLLSSAGDALSVGEQPRDRCVRGSPATWLSRQLAAVP